MYVEVFINCMNIHRIFPIYPEIFEKTKDFFILRLYFYKLYISILFADNFYFKRKEDYYEKNFINCFSGCNALLNSSRIYSLRRRFLREEGAPHGY